MHETWSLPYPSPDSAISIKILRRRFTAGIHSRPPPTRTTRTTTTRTRITTSCHPSASAIHSEAVIPTTTIMRGLAAVDHQHPLSISRPIVGMFRGSAAAALLRPPVLPMRRPLSAHLPTHLASPSSSSNNPTHHLRLASTLDRRPGAQQRPADRRSAEPISDSRRRPARPSTVRPSNDASASLVAAEATTGTWAT